MKRPDVVTYCEHGAEEWRKTRDGRPACALCRRLAPRSPDKQPRRQGWAQPVLDVAALAANDDSLPPVIDLAARRRNRNRKPKEI